jgi:endo-alpha-1,4-polygalactosaminidase (GH114 family)
MRTPRLLKSGPRLVGAALLLLTVATLGPSLASATPGTPEPPDPAPCSGCWHPGLDTSWNWVLSRVPQAPYRNVDMYDVDGFEASRADVAAMHADGMKVVCYLSAGTREKYRPDADQFPAKLLGAKNGWPGERWLDIRELQKPDSVLRTIMDARLDRCQAKGFDMVELDNVDGYLNRSGFPLTAADQLFYNATLANDTHERGMSVLQKNDNEQIPKLLPYFDGALNEQCNQYKECTTKQNGRFGLDQYVDAGLPVFQAEYKLRTGQFCAADNANSFNGARFALNLRDELFEPCR